jgi:hypothetical protein
VAAIVGSMPGFVPPHVVPPARAIKGVALIAGFLRNPLEIVPQDAYEQDYVAFNGLGPRFAWVTGPDLIKTVLPIGSGSARWPRPCSGATTSFPLYRCS